MKKSLKILALVMGAILLVCGSVAATLAWLTSQTEEVQNTFTVGNVTITLDEADVDDSTPDADRDIANEYHLIPSQTYEKDPTVHVAAGSENCYLFVRVQNDISGIEDSANTIAAQMATNGWVAVPGAAGVYYKGADGQMAVATANTNHVVFEEFTIAGTTTNAQLNSIDATKVITVQAFAVQTAGIPNTDIAAAWAAAQVA